MAKIEAYNVLEAIASVTFHIVDDCARNYKCDAHDEHRHSMYGKYRHVGWAN
jgi:hypothetical protein